MYYVRLVYIFLLKIAVIELGLRELIWQIFLFHETKT